VNPSNIRKLSAEIYADVTKRDQFYSFEHFLSPG